MAMPPLLIKLQTLRQTKSCDCVLTVVCGENLLLTQVEVVPESTVRNLNSMPQKLGRLPSQLLSSMTQLGGKLAFSIGLNSIFDSPLLFPWNCSALPALIPTLSNHENPWGWSGLVRLSHPLNPFFNPRKGCSKFWRHFGLDWHSGTPPKTSWKISGLASRQKTRQKTSLSRG